MGRKKREWLIKIRVDANLTQLEVSELIGINRSTYTKTELGFSLSVDQAKKIATLFGFHWTRFFSESVSQNNF